MFIYTWLIWFALILLILGLTHEKIVRQRSWLTDELLYIHEWGDVVLVSLAAGLTVGIIVLVVEQFNNLLFKKRAKKKDRH